MLDFPLARSFVYSVVSRIRVIVETDTKPAANVANLNHGPLTKRRLPGCYGSVVQAPTSKHWSMRQNIISPLHSTRREWQGSRLLPVTAFENNLLGR